MYGDILTASPLLLNHFISQVDPWTCFQETDGNRIDRIVTLRCCSIRNQGIPFGEPWIFWELANVVHLMLLIRLLLKHSHVSVGSTCQRLGCRHQNPHVCAHITGGPQRAVSTDTVQTPSRFQHLTRTMVGIELPPNSRLGLRRRLQRIPRRASSP
jgi:hypothetical protein